MTSEDKVYRELQIFLDKETPGSFRATESGAEIKLLKYLFTPEEARVAVHLSMEPEPVKVIHDRVTKSGMSITLEELQKMLDNMLRRGTLKPRYEGYTETHYCRTDTKSGGMLTVQVNRLTPEFLELMREYRSTFEKGLEAPPKEDSALRTVPVAKSIDLPEKYPVGNYDDIRKIIGDLPGPFAVTGCICRQMARVRGESCSVTELEQACLLVGPDHARFHVEMGIGRYITKDEVFELLDKAQQDGLVVQPENSLKPEAICLCCGDCCVYLGRYKKLPRPADMYLSNFYAEVNPELCTGCGSCIEKCQMEARLIENDVTVIDLDRCIGCGNCVVFCPEGATQMRKKEEEWVPVKDKDVFYRNILAAKKNK